jgi:hypothetical protein
MMREHIRMQLDEAFGPVNRWYCSEYYGYEVQDRETLLRYYIKHGGAQDFAATKSPLRKSASNQDIQKH